MILSEYLKRPKCIIRDVRKFRNKATNQIMTPVARLLSLGKARCSGNNFDFNLFLEIACIPVLYAVCLYSRRKGKRSIDVGLGPEPLINNIYHKRALIKYGYTAETFVYLDNFISGDYDINLASKKWSPLRKALFLFVRSLFRYKAIFIYMNGGSLFNTQILRFLEPAFYKAANLKVVVMPFGSDVQVMIHSKNLYFRHTLAMDYPHQNYMHQRVSDNIERWTTHADWILSGCEWVDYMYHWNSLQLAHFSIDMSQWTPTVEKRIVDYHAPFRIFHAPNHKTIKGTQELIKAVDKLKGEGLNIELVLMRGVPNTVIRKTIEEVDLVADQFVIGWYAMFAIEAMSLKKPVLCYLRPDLIELYTKAGLIEPGEIPLINTDLLEIAEKIRWAYHNREELLRLGEQGREYVRNHHSLESIGKDFANIMQQIGIPPSLGKLHPGSMDLQSRELELKKSLVG